MNIKMNKKMDKKINIKDKNILIDNIRDKIVKTRKKRIKTHGYNMGAIIPESRCCPIIPFGIDPFLICEVKRKSPSKGNIALGLDAVEQASMYIKNGIKHISVLTEQDYFQGSLDDLMSIKKAFPEISTLRKDFLLDREDILISFRAGADAVLLIASILDKEKLNILYNKAKSLGMEVLLEVHNKADIEKVRNIKPVLTGINSRNLSTFVLDPIVPLRIKRHITWETRLVFESGIKSKEDCLFALSSGFSGILVGEAVLRDNKLVSSLLEVFMKNDTEKSDKNKNFWEKLYLREKENRPLIKICGITTEEDAFLCSSLGADILGFVFAPSKRRATPELLRRIKNLDILKVAVVVTPESEDNNSKIKNYLNNHNNSTGGLDPEVKNLLEDGLIDAVQFHGDETPENCFKMAFPYYKAVRLDNTKKDKDIESDIEKIESFRCPRVLIDSFSPGLKGGTGKRIPDELVDRVRKKHPIWIAGGIGEDNVCEIICKFNPELIDASSRLESSPGKKDHEKLKTFFKNI